MTGSNDVWSTFTYDPRDPQYAALRAADKDRSIVLQVLTDAYADGRLDREEFDERCARANEVRLLGDLAPLLLDLVAASPPTMSLAHASRRDLEQRAERAWESRRREAALSFLGPSLVCLAIWFATAWQDDEFEPYFFWPAFVIVFTALHLIRTLVRHTEIVDEELRRLEKRRSKERRRPPHNGTAE